MKYKKVKLVFKYCEAKRFFRTLLVDENINLVDLGCAFVTSLGGEFEHNFYFRTKNNTYNPQAFMNDFSFDDDLLMDNFTLKDLGNKFEFCYDTGDGWDFKVTVTDSNVEMDEEEVKLIKGAGQGIWEDNISTLFAYFDGRLDPNSAEPDEDNGYYPPWNFHIDKYSDFDEYDLESEQEEFYELYCSDKEIYKSKQAFYNSDLEDEDALDEDDTDFLDRMFPPEFYHAMTEVINVMINEVDDINSVYKKLKEKNDAKKAKELLIKEFIFQHYLNSKEGKNFNIDEYIKDIKNLIQ